FGSSPKKPAWRRRGRREQSLSAPRRCLSNRCRGLSGCALSFRFDSQRSQLRRQAFHTALLFLGLPLLLVRLTLLLVRPADDRAGPGQERGGLIHRCPPGSFDRIGRGAGREGGRPTLPVP